MADAGNGVVLRDAVMEDEKLLFIWANDAETRSNSFSTETIPYEKHHKWYQELLSRSDAKQYIMAADGIDVGQVRITVTGDTAEIGYSIAPEHRGRGYGKLLISLSPDVIKRDFPQVKMLTAQVKPENVASRKVFLDNQYTEKCLVYEIKLD